MLVYKWLNVLCCVTDCWNPANEYTGWCIPHSRSMAKIESVKLVIMRVLGIVNWDHANRSSYEEMKSFIRGFGKEGVMIGENFLSMHVDERDRVICYFTAGTPTLKFQLVLCENFGKHMIRDH